MIPWLPCWLHWSLSRLWQPPAHSSTRAVRGLLFIFLPHLIRSMPGGWLIAIIFFTAVFLAGMTSLMNLYEAPIATVQEKTGFSRIPSCCIIAGIGAVVSLLIQGIVSNWMGHCCPSTSAPWAQAWPESCCSGCSESSMWKMKSTRVESTPLPNGFIRSVNISMYRFVFWC